MSTPPVNDHDASEASNTSIAKLDSERLLSFFRDVFTLLQEVDRSQVLLSSVISESTDYSDLSSVSMFQKLSDIVTPTSVIEKIQREAYKSVLELYYDIKISCVSRLANLEVGSTEYNNVDHFFKFATQLLFREGERLQLLSPTMSLNEKNVALPQEDDSNDFQDEVIGNYRKIYADAELSHGEAHFVVAHNGPLFSSLVNRSLADPRETKAPQPFNLTKVFPPLRNSPAYQLGFLTPSVSRIPHPALPPTEMMTTFIHPNNTYLPSGKFLKSDPYNSFAPTNDNSHAMVDTTDIGSIWFERIGQTLLNAERTINDSLKQVVDEQSDIEHENDMEDDDDDEEEEIKLNDKPESEAIERDQKIEDYKGDLENIEHVKNTEKTPAENNDMDIDVTGDPNGKPEHDRTTLAIENVDSVAEESSMGDENLIEAFEEKKDVAAENVLLSFEEDLDVAEVFAWSPYNYIEDDELEAAKNGTELQLISDLILQLQQLQSNRLSRNDGTEFVPSKLEKRLALKIQGIFTRIANDYTPKDLGSSNVSSLLPVLQANYPGVFPAPELPKQFIPSSTRPASLNSSKSKKPSRR
ncbi:hypothetical protein NADFUDRAFT_46392 [Nadsonia fulvescens var. elongata DSM 6958]|uniref:DUF7877 domain-containing protein n=1 Tax=Nadsonia fulvescens var. elongata DSM 6958 TaxID=857566 RepID=A0A1E3PK05_9ASCO|nr:hypothetical protein NADFUDRAFT_46392 [Nadsonia fulvescens var. elongata DSM 6958]